ncbi:MAG: inositol monophosphatase, partial [Muribaculaceae bacterium]|nr:inositol monophosphatase [Muribaculaceae bacterium]
NNIDNVARVLPLVRGMRRLGAAAWDICAVAAGYLDAYWEMNLHKWDVCAATLIAEEAGAVVKDFRADRNVSIMVAAPGVADKIFPLLK